MQVKFLVFPFVKVKIVSVEVTFEQRPEEREGASCKISGGEAFQVVGCC